MITAEDFAEPRTAPAADDLAVLVAEHGPLPRDYAGMLALVDGGTPVHDRLVFDTGSKVLSLGIRSLYGAASVLTATRNMTDQGLVPPGTLVIGEDLSAGHHHLLLSIDPQHNPGTVLITVAPSGIEPQTASLDAFEGAGAVRIADSVTKLITSVLISEDEVDERVRHLKQRPQPAQSRPRVEPAPVHVPHEAGEVYLYDGRTDLRYMALKGIKENDGIPRTSSWQPIELELNDSRENSKYDLLRAGSFQVLRPAAVDAIGALLLDYGELLETTTAEGPMFVFRCLNRVDALRDSADAITADGGYPNSYELRFDLDVVKDAAVFTLVQQDQDRWTNVFYSREIVAHIEAHVRTRPFTAIPRYHTPADRSAQTVYASGRNRGRLRV